MKRTAVLLGLLVGIATGTGNAATLTITPDKQVYEVGEQITLSVFGDAGGIEDNAIFGRILFDAGLAGYVNSHQDPLTSLGGSLTWLLGPLDGGGGFADAFSQFPSPTIAPDGPLTASVNLLATAPGTLDYSWQTGGSLTFRLDFFGLTAAPGGGVTIVPEPSTGVLVAFGLIATCIALRAGPPRFYCRSGPLPQRAIRVRSSWNNTRETQAGRRLALSG